MTISVHSFFRSYFYEHYSISCAEICSKIYVQFKIEADEFWNNLLRGQKFLSFGYQSYIKITILVITSGKVS